jgi:hypothetical protein
MAKTDRFSYEQGNPSVLTSDRTLKHKTIFVDGNLPAVKIGVLDQRNFLVMMVPIKSLEPIFWGDKDVVAAGADNETFVEKTGLIIDPGQAITLDITENVEIYVTARPGTVAMLQFAESF